MKTFGTTLTLISLLLFSCNPESGPCEWAETRALAEVVDIVPYGQNEHGDSLFHVHMQFNGTVYAEKIQLLDELKGIEIRSSTLAKNRIRIGTSYRTTVSEVRKGNCKSPILSFDARIVE